MQPKLLRFLDHGEYYRVGDPQPRTADIRLIAATNRDLPAMIITGKFREDLYYRIAEATIALPPLRHRLDDFLPLAIHVCNQLQIPPHQSRPTPYTLFRWLKHRYLPENPALRGNIREFSGALKRAIAEGELEPFGDTVVPELWHQAHIPCRPLQGLPFVGATTYTETTLHAADYRIARTLGLTQRDAARLLGITESQLSRWKPAEDIQRRPRRKPSAPAKATLMTSTRMADAPLMP